MTVDVRNPVLLVAPGESGTLELARDVRAFVARGATRFEEHREIHGERDGNQHRSQSPAWAMTR